MIDTISINLHQVGTRYRELLKYLYNTKKGKFNKVTLLKSPVSINFMEINERDEKIQTIRMNRKLTLKSSSREINVSYEQVKDILAFEFSIPKALYGTNIFQFLKSPYSAESFNMTYDIKIEEQLKSLRKRLFNFILKFFKEALYVTVTSERKYLERKDNEILLISMMDIEIKRLDFCFNRIFRNKTDAMNYLEALKRIKRKASREIPKNARFSYSSSIYEVTEYFTYKIYFKGLEFEKVDKPALKKINENVGYQKYNLDVLQKFADKILRYEIEFKKSGLNYVYKHRLYKKNDSLHKPIKRDFDRYIKNEKIIKRYIDNKNDLAKLNIFNIKYGYMNYNEALNKLFNENKALKKNYQYQISIFNKRANFYMEVTDEQRELMEIFYSINDVVRYENKTLLTNELVQECGKILIDFIKQFTIKETELKNVDNFIRVNNKRQAELRKKGLKSFIITGNLLRYIKLLDRYSHDEISKMKIFERTTLYRLRKKAETMGLNKNNILVEKIVTSENYSDYFCELQSNELNKYLF